MRLLDREISYRDINDKRIHEFLYYCSKDMGFREYFRKRDLTLLKTISLGVNREEYLILVGQRAELLNLLGKVDNADKIEIRKAEQLKAANKIKKPK